MIVIRDDWPSTSRAGQAQPDQTPHITQAQAAGGIEVSPLWPNALSKGVRDQAGERLCTVISLDAAAVRCNV